MQLPVTFAAVVFLVAASASLHWRYVHDSPSMIYAGFPVASGSVSYRDLFDMNIPGTYLVMAVRSVFLDGFRPSRRKLLLDVAPRQWAITAHF